MNAPVPAAALAAPTITMIALKDLDPSTTHIQALRRSRFDKKLLSELAESIKVVGVLQPILARRSQANGRADRFEIVAGERRFLAAREAGLAEIPATVRDLSDEQVLEVQLIENLQREGLHELEEAEGYEELMKLKKVSSDVVADMVGRSKSYVLKRVKLLALSPESRKAFYAGELDASTALLIARIPGHDLQKKAMAELEEQRNYGDVANFKDAQRFIHENYMLSLKAAPFKTDDANLVAKAGACTTCPKRTGNQKDLFGDVKSGDTCTDPKCFAEKRQAGEKQLVAEHKAKGVEVIVGEAAKRIFPYGDRHASGGYHRTDEQNYSDPKRRKYGEMVDKSEIKLVVSPKSGELVKVVHSSALPKAKKKSKSAARAKAKAEGKNDSAVTEAVIRAIHEKYDGELAKGFLQHLVHEVLVMAENMYADDELVDAFAALWGLKSMPASAFGAEALPKSLQGFDAKKLARFSIELVALFSLADGDGKRAEAICSALKIDLKKIVKGVAVAAKAKAAAEKGDKQKGAGKKK